MVFRKPAADDPFAAWFVTPMPYGGVTQQRIPWPAVAAGEFWSAHPRGLTPEGRRTLARWLRRELAETLGVRQRKGT
ncbi:hypothetical protein [Streptomyces sp. gCLA4]|uniref:hypothetical protein n=1 Tax=Streptomyces sp. gCLA4 TaxID=1873416 RepID=UPI001601287C|nr:hypothetical protein [Streptomyces sp. gCLA4]